MPLRGTFGSVEVSDGDGVVAVEDALKQAGTPEAPHVLAHGSLKLATSTRRLRISCALGRLGSVYICTAYDHSNTLWRTRRRCHPTSRAASFGDYWPTNPLSTEDAFDSDTNARSHHLPGCCDRLRATMAGHQHVTSNGVTSSTSTSSRASERRRNQTSILG